LQPPVRGLAPAANRRLQQFARRLTNSGQLSVEALAEVNRIADDAGRPLGEAVALLDWSAYSRRAPWEGEDTHLARLAEWGVALADYRDRLADEVGLLEARFRGLLGIWELWRWREDEPDGRAAWTNFVEGRRRALRDEADRLRHDVAALEAHLAGGRKP
jgi:hypothetical protein